MSLAGVKVGDTLMVGGHAVKAEPVIVGKVGREWVYTEQDHAYRIATGRARSTNGFAQTVAQWRRSMQAVRARAELRASGVDLGHQVDAVLVYETLRSVFALPELPALESFEVPK